MDFAALVPILIFTIFLFAASSIAVFDVATYRIPNAISIVLVAGFAVGAVAFPGKIDVPSHLASGLIIFGAGFAAFWFGLLGAGDVKSWAAVALWFDLNTLPAQALSVALFGGVLGLFLLLLRHMIARVQTYRPSNGAGLPRLLRHGQPIPYGMAISSGAIVMSWASPFFPGPW